MAKEDIKNRMPLTLFLGLGFILLVLLMCFSITQGPANIHLGTIYEVLFDFDATSTNHLIVRDLRIPRVLTSAFIGAAFAVAGAIMQGITRNPMADSGILGINSGAAFAVALCYAMGPSIRYGSLIIFAFLGAGAAAVIVFGIALSNVTTTNPARFILAGAAVAALLTGLSQGISLGLDIGLDVLFWTIGGVVSVTWEKVYIVVPILSVALVGAVMLAPYISIVNMGEEIAKGLGIHTKIIQGLSTVIVLALAGVSVANVGAVSFVGLIVPHLSRYFVGVDYKKIIPSTALLGAIFLVMADLGAKTINPPAEVPLGVITALVGVPFFLFISKKERGCR